MLCKDGVHAFTIWAPKDYPLDAVEQALRYRAARNGDEVVSVQRAGELPPMDVMAEMDPVFAKKLEEHGWDDAHEYEHGYLAIIRTGDRPL